MHWGLQRDTSAWLRNKRRARGTQAGRANETRGTGVKACSPTCTRKVVWLPRAAEVLHPWAPGPSALGVTARVLRREVHGHRVFVVELQAGKELPDNMGMVS